MAEVLLFHHVLGQTPGFLAFAEDLRKAGHTVFTPDVFEGRTFKTIDDGISHAREQGFGELMERGVRAADALPEGLVYAGISFGVMPAQKLAQTRLGARGALFFESCVPVEEFSPAWPADVPVQVHGMEGDPFFAEEGDLDAARALVEAAPQGELLLYPGNQHLFADSSLPSFEPEAAALLKERVLAFLAAV